MARADDRVTVGGRCSEDVERQIHEYLHIHEVLMLRSLSTKSRELIQCWLRRYQWDVVLPQCANMCRYARCLNSLLEARANISTIHLVRCFESFRVYSPRAEGFRSTITELSERYFARFPLPM